MKTVIGITLAIVVISMTVIWVVLPTIFLEPDRNNTFPKDPIWFVSSPNVISDVDFHINTNTGKENHEIWFEYNVRFLDKSEPGFIAFVLPYQGELKVNDEWNVFSNDEGTAFVKEFVCDDPHCNFNDNQNFIFTLDRKIDFKQAYHHSINFKFENYFGGGELADFILNFDKHPNIHKLGFNEMSSPTVTVVLDTTTDNIDTTPTSISDSYSDRSKQRVWPIEAGITYQIDFQIPAERKAQDNLFFLSTVASMGLAIGGVVFPVMMSLRNPSNTNNARSEQEFDLQFKPVIELGEPKPLFGITEDRRFHWGDVDAGIIPISIWDFGIIYEVEITSDKTNSTSISIKKTTSKSNITKEDFSKISERENQIISSKKSCKTQVQTPIIFTKDLEENPYFIGIEIQHEYMGKIEKIVKVWKILSVYPSIHSEWHETE